MESTCDTSSGEMCVVRYLNNVISSDSYAQTMEGRHTTDINASSTHENVSYNLL